MLTLVESYSEMIQNKEGAFWLKPKLAIDIAWYKKGDIVDSLSYNCDSGELILHHQDGNCNYTIKENINGNV